MSHLASSEQPREIIASVLHGPRDFRLETRLIPPPASDELQIAIKVTGICGSDVAYYKFFANGDLRAREPLSLGHESSGEVVAVGAKVIGFRVGDRVAVEAGVPCQNCGICQSGRYNLCNGLRFRSSAKTYPHYQGTLQERINHPAVWCHKLPEHVSYVTGALLEPLSVAIHAANRASLSLGAKALVIGAGTIGLLTAAVALQSGCKSVTITDLNASRVEFALVNGFATHGCIVPETDTIMNIGAPGLLTPESELSVADGKPLEDRRFQAARLVAAHILGSSFSPRADSPDTDDKAGFDVTFECTGKQISIQTGLYATKPGGKVMMIGMGTPVQTVPLSVAHFREVDILGVFRYANTYPIGIRLLEAQIDRQRRNMLPSLERLVTHRFKGLENVQKAFEMAGCASGDTEALVIKVIVEI